MTSPGGVEVARASVKFVPDTSNIPADLKAQLERIESRVRVELPVSLGTSTLVADARKLAALAEESAKVQLATLLDGQSLQRQVKTATEQAGKTATVKATVEVDPLDSAFQTKVRSDLRKLAATLELNVPAGIRGEVLRRQVSAQIKAVEQGLAVEVPTRPAQAAEYRRRLQDQLRLVERTVEATVPVEVDLDVPAKQQAEVAAKVGATKRRLERNPVRIPLDIDTSSLAAVSRQIATLGGGLAGAGVGAVAGQAVAGGLVAIAAALAQTAGAMALIPAAGAAGVAVVATLRLGLVGLEDALTADSAKEYAEALEKLPPQARNLVVALRDLAPEFDRLRRSVQDRLLDRLSNDAQALAEIYLPLARRGLGDLADELNVGIRQLAGFGREAETIRVFRDALGDSARATSLLSEALRPAARGLRSLVDVGSEFLPGLAAQVAVLAERWSLMLQRSADDGRLQEWISQALESIGDLASIAGNLGSTLGSVFRAGKAAGAGLLDVVDEITQKIADFAASEAGQASLGSFFSSAADLARGLLPLLEAAVRLVGDQLAPLLSSVGLTVIPALVTAFDAVGRALTAAGPGIEAFAGGVASVITSLAEGGAIEAVGELAGALGGALGDALVKVGPKLAELVTVVAGELTGALPDVVSGIADVAVALADMLIAGSPLIGFLGRLVSEVGLPVLKRVAENLAPIIRDLAKSLSEGDLAAKLPEIADSMIKFVDELAPLVGELVTAALELVDAIVPHMDDIVGSMKDLAQAALPVAKALTAVSSAVGTVSKGLDDLTESVPGLKAALGDGGLFGKLTTFTNPISAAKGLYDTVGQLTRIMQGEYPGSVKTFVDATGSIAGQTRVSFEELRNRAIETFGENGLGGLITRTAPVLTDIFLNELGRMNDGSFTIFGSLLASVTDHFGRMEQEISDHVFGVSDAVDRAWARVAEATSRQWAEVDRRVAQGIIDVGDETAKLPGVVRSSLGNIEAVLEPSGASLVQGLIVGMKSREFAVRRAAAAIMEVAAAFFPSSPAKMGPFSGRGWTPYRGAALVEGFAEGMTSSIAGAVRAAEQVATSVADQLPTGSAFPGMAGAAPRVYAPIDARGTDPERVAAIVPHRIMAALNTT